MKTQTVPCLGFLPGSEWFQIPASQIPNVFDYRKHLELLLKCRVWFIRSGVGPEMLPVYKLPRCCWFTLRSHTRREVRQVGHYIVCIWWLKIFQKILDEEGKAPYCAVLETLFQNEHLGLSKFSFPNGQRQFVSLLEGMSSLCDISMSEDTSLLESKERHRSWWITSLMYPWSLFNVMISPC